VAKDEAAKARESKDTERMGDMVVVRNGPDWGTAVAYDHERPQFGSVCYPTIPERNKSGAEQHSLVYNSPPELIC
jgi:hypothetical protein